jgi:hypothetical protein
MRLSTSPSENRTSSIHMFLWDLRT